MKLYSYFRSSASYRVRIALALKGLSYEYVAVHLVKNEQLGEPFRALSPSQLVPALVLDEPGDRAADPVAGDHRVPRGNPSRAAAAARRRARPGPGSRASPSTSPARSIRSTTCACCASWSRTWACREDDKNRWYRHWVETGLETVERQLAGNAATGRFCHGDTPGLADCVLVPQIHNAQRMTCRLDHVPTVMRVYENCMAEAAFSTTQASACPDAA